MIAEKFIRHDEVATLVRDGDTVGLIGGGGGLVEVAPGIDIEADILSRMAFRPVVNPPIQIMSSAHFNEHRQ